MGGGHCVHTVVQNVDLMLEFLDLSLTSWREIKCSTIYGYMDYITMYYIFAICFLTISYHKIFLMANTTVALNRTIHN